MTGEDERLIMVSRRFNNMSETLANFQQWHRWQRALNPFFQPVSTFAQARNGSTQGWQKLANVIGKLGSNFTLLREDCRQRTSATAAKVSSSLRLWNNFVTLSCGKPQGDSLQSQQARIKQRAGSVFRTCHPSLRPKQLQNKCSNIK